LKLPLCTEAWRVCQQPYPINSESGLLPPPTVHPDLHLTIKPTPDDLFHTILVLFSAVA